MSPASKGTVECLRIRRGMGGHVYCPERHHRIRLPTIVANQVPKCGGKGFCKNLQEILFSFAGRYSIRGSLAVSEGLSIT